MRISIGVALGCFLLVLFADVAASQERPSIFIGPQVRDGFLDVDSGIRDSIRDIQEEFQQHPEFKFRIITTREETPVLTLIVVARGIVTNGSVGFGTSINGTGSGFVVPNSTPTLTTLLRIGHYEKTTQSEGGTWRYAAKTAVKDVLAWWEANQQTVRALK